MSTKSESQLESFQTSALEKSVKDVDTTVEEEPRLETAAVSNFLRGSRLHVLTLGLILSIFLVNFEISIVSTSLVSITNDLSEFGSSSWVITAYLLTYTAFMVIIAKLSDQVGRKTVLVSSMIFFTIFSGACGAAQSMNQLIVFRAFQGLGASGIYSLVIIVMFEMVPPEKFPMYSIYVTLSFAISLCIGPLCGGAINDSTTWRWVFLLNVPAGVVASIILLLFIPKYFPHHDKPHQRQRFKIGSIDAVGAMLMLATIMLLIVGFEEASNFKPWRSARVLAPILASSPFLLAFLFYERFLTLRKNGVIEPVFPWRFCRSRVIMGILANAFLSGVVFTSCIIQIPLRFQAVNAKSPWQAGLRLISFGVAVPVGATLTAAVCGKKRLPIIYMMFAASLFQAIGIGFMSTMTVDRLSWNGQYGLQFIAGTGCGFAVGSATLMMPAVIEKRDLATSTSAVVQLRMLGGALGLALVTAIMNSSLKHTLAQMLSAQQIAQVFRTTETIAHLPEPIQTRVREAFLNGYNTQLHILVGFAAAQTPATLLIWQKEPVRIS